MFNPALSHKQIQRISIIHPQQEIMGNRNRMFCCENGNKDRR